MPKQKYTIKEKLIIAIAEIGFKVLGKNKMAYILGIKLKPTRMFSNDGWSDHSWTVASCHPLNSITWHWALYWTKPLSGKITLKYIKNWCGFHFHKQELMIRDK